MEVGLEGMVERECFVSGKIEKLQGEEGKPR